jgi:hypothetical protein
MGPERSSTPGGGGYAAPPTPPTTPYPEPLIERIRQAINCTSREGVSNTSDRVLAQFLMNSLESFEIAIRGREEDGPERGLRGEVQRLNQVNDSLKYEIVQLRIQLDENARRLRAIRELA